MKFNEYDSVVVSAGYDKSLRVWDCKSRSSEPIQVNNFPMIATSIRVNIFSSTKS